MRTVWELITNLQQQIHVKDAELERVKEELKAKEITIKQVIADSRAEVQTKSTKYEKKELIKQIRQELLQKQEPLNKLTPSTDHRIPLVSYL